jgi:hypothetical protein
VGISRVYPSAGGMHSRSILILYFVQFETCTRDASKTFVKYNLMKDE